MNKAQLQEKALQLDVQVLDENDRELTKDELLKAIEIREAELLKEEEEKKRSKDAAAKEQAKAQRKAKRAKTALEAEEVAARMHGPDPIMPSDEFLKANGLKVSQRDIELSKKYGYRVAVPQAKVYKTRVGFCSAVDHEHRPEGSIVLCAPFEVANKSEYLTLIEE